MGCEHTCRLKTMQLDLHGNTIHSAWKLYRSHTQICYLNKIKKTTVIIGHGIMATEFKGWVSSDPYALECERLDPNTGAWRVTIKKSPIKKEENKKLNLIGLYKKFHK